MQQELGSRQYFTPEKHPEFYQHKEGSIAYRQLAIPVSALTEGNVDGFLDVNNPEWNTLSRDERLRTLRDLYDAVGFSKLFTDYQVLPTIRRARVPRLSLSASLNIATSSVYGRSNIFCQEPYVRILVTGNLKEDEPVMNPKREGDIDGEIGLVDTLGGNVDVYFVVGHAKNARFFEIKDYNTLRRKLNGLSTVTDKNPRYHEDLSEVVLSDNVPGLVRKGVISEDWYLSNLNLISFSAWDMKGKIKFISDCMSGDLRERLLESGIVDELVGEIDQVELPTYARDNHARQILEILHCSIIEPSLVEDVNLPLELENKVGALKGHLDRLILQA
jgi:hypothetical protein